ncbi:unknown [Clostridium sp. CAG:448]|nr:unknown [Clostridium sp. CAG:448]
MPKKMRSMAIARKIPTPVPTPQIRSVLSMEVTYPANTCRSGSETVIITPTKKEIGRIIHSFLVCVI